MKIRFPKPKVPDRFGAEVKMETRRTLGVTPKLVGLYPESPARMLPKTTSLRVMARGKRSI